MPTLTTELIARLKDQISGPAAKAGRALDGLVGKANKAAGRRGVMAAVGDRTYGAARELVAFAGVAGATALAVKSYRDFAAFDRQMTRIGITAEATAGEVANAKKQLFDIANNTGLGVDTVREGLDTLTAAGRNMKDSLAFLPSVAKTAQASGAEVADIANTADAIGNSMGITSDKMQGAFDILAKAGKAGKFELKDMAQYLPAIAPAAAAIGMKGTDGLIKLAAALQMTRNQTGDASSAATNLQNVFQKMTSQETVGKFKKMGIKDLRGQLDKAKKSGKDVFDTFLDITEAATKGDLSKIPLLFNDAQMQAGMRALISQRQQMRELRGELGNASGTVDRDFAKVANDAASGMEKLATATGKFGIALGGVANAIGVTKEIAQLAKMATEAADGINRLQENIKNKGTVGGIADTVKQNAEDRKNNPKGGSWAGPAFDGVLPPDWELENRRLRRVIASQGDENDPDIARQLEAKDRADLAFANTPASDQARAKATRDATIAAADAEIALISKRNGFAQQQADAREKLQDRIVGAYYADHPDFKAPARPYSPTPGTDPVRPAVPMPVPRPAEIAPPAAIAPKVDTTHVDQATELLQGVDTAITNLNGKTAVVTVQPQGMQGVIADLERAMGLINKINGSRVQMPSGGPGRAASHGTFADTGIH